MRLAPSRAISSSVSVISPACTEEVSVDSLSMGGVSFPPPASGVFVCWAHAEGYAALFHPIKSRDPQLLRIPPHRLARGAWKEYDACAPSGCLRVQGILLGGSPRILRLQTVFRILNSARSCRIRVESRRVAPEPSGAEGAAEPRPEGPEPRSEGAEPRPEGPESRSEGPEPRRRSAPPVPGEAASNAAARRPSCRPAPRSSSSR